MDAEARRRQLSAALNRVARGDRAALRLVYEMTSAKLFGVCLRILNDRSEAEDVLQDVYLTVWRKAASFDEARAARSRGSSPSRGTAPSTGSAQARSQG
ncbi:MAG: sigma factor [Methyloceanibacter sp.]